MSKCDFVCLEYFKVQDVKPPQGLVVMTKVEDEKGIRNEQPLKRSGSLWFEETGSMYVYYTPTHWAYLE